MTLSERWLEFPVEPSGGRPSGEVALVIDASASAHSFREQIFRLSREVLAGLGADTRRSVFFLGNPLAYDAALFDVDFGRWYDENQGRTSLVGPVFRVLGGRRGVSALVLAAGRLFDLEDWLGPSAPQGHRVFIRFGEDPLTTDPRCVQEPAVATPAKQIVSRLDRKWVAVELSGPGWMPIFWDNHDYQWDGASLVFRGEGDPFTRVGLIGRAPDQVRPRARLANYLTEEVDSRTIAPIRPDEWAELSDAEAKVFHDSVQRGEYTCPMPGCGRTHRADQLRCPRTKTDSILGAPIYRFLGETRATGPWRGYGLLREAPGRVEVRRHACPTLRISATSVALRTGHQVVFHRFDPVSGRWQASPRESLPPYTPLEDNSYAVVL